MKLSAPIYHLKRKAKQLAREHSVPLHGALDRIALRSPASQRVGRGSDLVVTKLRCQNGDLTLPQVSY